MLLVILLLLSAVLTIVLFKNKNGDYWKKRNIRQVNGTTKEFVLGSCSMSEVYKRVYDKYPNETNIGIFVGSKPALLLRDLENVQAVFAGDFQSFYSRGIATNNPNDILGDNVLLIEDYARWKTIRQHVSPVFTSMKLKSMFSNIDRCARDFVEMFADNLPITKQPFKALYTYTTASIGASVFGIDTKTENTMNSPFVDMAWNTTDPTFKKKINFFIANTFPKLYRILDLKMFGQHETFFVGVVKKVLESRRNDSGRRHDFIDVCLEIQRQGVMRDTTTGYELEPTDEILAAQAFFFFIAGADTSANGMHFTLLELSSNPDILKRVHEEIDEVFTICNDQVTYNDIEKLQYLDMVLSEALRKYPSIGFIQRKCTKDTILPAGNVKIEKDTIIITPVYALQRDEKYYPDPDVFDPERFSPENAPKLAKFSYLAFGEGHRICFGMKFARLQVKSGIARLLRRYTLREQSLASLRFERSVFSLRAPNFGFELVPRT